MNIGRLSWFFRCNNCGKIHCRALIGPISLCACGRILVKDVFK